MMDKEEFLAKYIYPFSGISYIMDYRGCIVWRTGTGGNIEILHITASHKRRGYGTQLFIDMLYNIIDAPPHYSIFGFTRVDNKEAHLFYEALGFKVEPAHGLYKEGECRMFWSPFQKLRKLYLGEEDGPSN